MKIILVLFIFTFGIILFAENVTDNQNNKEVNMKEETVLGIEQTDPEFSEFFEYFAFNEVVNQKGQQLPERERYMAILATLLGSQSLDMFEIMISKALDGGVTPIEIKEITYQSVAYLGIGRVYPFIKSINKVFETKGIIQPLEKQGTTNKENKREKGTQAQVDIFGDNMKDFWKSGPEDTRHINYWLAENCFGDYYTRNGLDLAKREMITFCFISAQGGCEPQLLAHALGNMKCGNDKSYLIKVVSQCMPYIGYPRTLNALTAIEKANEQFTQSK